MVKSGYVRHRQNQREQIIEAAEDLFVSKGIIEVTILDITKAARITRPTFYKYFCGKEETAIEIFKSITKGWAERGLAEVWNREGSGHEIIELFISSLFKHLLKNPREARFVAEFNYLYGKNFSGEEVQNILRENLAEEEVFLLERIIAGQADGSVRKDISPEAIRAAVFNFAAGLNGRLGVLGPKLESEYHINVDELFMQVCRIFLDGLKPCNSRAL